MSIMKYIKPKCEVIEMEDIVMLDVSDPTVGNVSGDSGNTTTGPTEGEPGSTPPSLSKDVFPWSDDFDFHMD